MENKRNEDRLMMLLSITERGSAGEIMNYLNRHNIQMHFQSSGFGTAPSEMMDFLGLGSSDKDVLISLGTQKIMERLAEELSDNLDAISRGKGIMMLFSLSAVNRLTVAIAIRQAGDVLSIEGEELLKNEYKHSLIFICVKQGYSEQVMHTARQAGATGGTVIRARMAGTDQIEQFHGISLQPEKEIITILASETIRDRILEAVNEELGLRSEAQGIVGALPVERAFKI